MQLSRFGFLGYCIVRVKMLSPFIHNLIRSINADIATHKRILKLFGMVVVRPQKSGATCKNIFDCMRKFSDNINNQWKNRANPRSPAKFYSVMEPAPHSLRKIHFEKKAAVFSFTRQVAFQGESMWPLLLESFGHFFCQREEN
ncbi:uncharacterized protein TM35_000064470 [Trypanosoma theileri]|uniref:Uncharacterized protein n=1 Tax=Trypanosoma theileri TaxID=67003 RepID=A0A1X0P3E7_9TRYP|nr:uncharacterized protein TM35_000064470 [Trypanosoma theileri]ORC91442.1 hypothetical protein TM35_000064470 [Trypanosoma theileri]